MAIATYLRGVVPAMRTQGASGLTREKLKNLEVRSGQFITTYWVRFDSYFPKGILMSLDIAGGRGQTLFRSQATMGVSFIHTAPLLLKGCP